MPETTHRMRGAVSLRLRTTLERRRPRARQTPPAGLGRLCELRRIRRFERAGCPPAAGLLAQDTVPPGLKNAGYASHPGCPPRC
ncbi:hypothetical protein [Aporhodopirellula aestuarii]|uniref:Uncharacterized protein n=1 Tax=Aporhodopirellula aestuarii TaxID=2950107 RepID=A0ABT0TXH9_9BACT|nr:hypothetical protein [Aporhodopirellula aestuarii]MCM2369289.1 hypothetical protein [Aporhodopirellula aestuarii]